jgi:hypothetical protein
MAITSKAHTKVLTAASCWGRLRTILCCCSGFNTVNLFIR